MVTNKAELVDIRTVRIDKGLPKHERLSEYVRQIKNPYLFKCGKYTITARYATNGISFEECLRRVVT